MPKRSWNGRRQREFERIRERLLFQGEPEGMAEQIATSRVNRDFPIDDGSNHLAMVAQLRTGLRTPRDEQDSWRPIASHPRNRGGARRPTIAARRAFTPRSA